MKNNFSVLDLEKGTSEWKYELARKLLSGGAIYSGTVFIVLGPEIDPQRFLLELSSKWIGFLKKRVWEELDYGTFSHLKNKGFLYIQIVKHWANPSLRIIRSPKTGKFGIKLIVSPTIPHLMKPLQDLKGKYFWSSSQMTPVKEGFRIPPMTMESIPKSRGRMLAEIIAEEIRQKEFPGRPSRIGSIFVCPGLSGFCGKQSFRKGGVYEVDVAGKTFETDGEIFTEIAMYALDDKQQAEEAARKYWRGTTKGSFPEVLVKGSVTVVRRVF